MTVIEIASEPHFHAETQYGGLKLDQVRRLMEQENGRLRKAVAELTLEKLILREAASGNY